jgi:transmembrane sensor
MGIIIKGSRMSNDKSDMKALLRRYIDNVYTHEEGIELLKEIRKNENNDILNDLFSEMWEESASCNQASGKQRHSYYKEAHHLYINIKRPYRRWLINISKYAAIAAVIALMAGVGYYFYNERQPQTSYLYASTSFGERKQVTLPDGSQVILNSCSRLQYPNKFVGNTRSVRLNGEAFFRVIHKEKKPFFVKTRNFNVKVLGTQFNVKSYPDDEIESIRVKSGKVQVDIPEAMMRIVAKEEVTINTISGEYSKHVVGEESYIWFEDNASLHFDRTPIRDAAHMLERYYHCHITFAPGQRFNNLISGTHDNTNLETVLKSIEFISGVHHKTQGKNILLYH